MGQIWWICKQLLREGSAAGDSLLCGLTADDEELQNPWSFQKELGMKVVKEQYRLQETWHPGQTDLK